MGRGLRVHHIALAAQNPAALADFYERVLELPRIREQNDAGAVTSVWLQLDANAILMIEAATTAGASANGFPEKRPGYHLIAFSIAAGERESWRTRLAEHGVEIVHETDFTLYFRDPEGNRVGLSHYPDG